VRIAKLGLEATHLGVGANVTGLAENDALGDLREPALLTPAPDGVVLLALRVEVVQLKVLARVTPLTGLVLEEHGAALGYPCSLISLLSLRV
jgi:hypothetical protein